MEIILEISNFTKSSSLKIGSTFKLYFFILQGIFIKWYKNENNVYNKPYIRAVLQASFSEYEKFRFTFNDGLNLE